MNEAPRPDHQATAGMPRWVKVFAVIALILILLFVVMHLTGNTLGDHNLTRGVH